MIRGYSRGIERVCINDDSNVTRGHYYTGLDGDGVDTDRK